MPWINEELCHVAEHMYRRLVCCGGVVAEIIRQLSRGWGTDVQIHLPTTTLRQQWTERYRVCVWRTQRYRLGRRVEPNRLLPQSILNWRRFHTKWYVYCSRLTALQHFRNFVLHYYYYYYYLSSMLSICVTVPDNYLLCALDLPCCVAHLHYTGYSISVHTMALSVLHLMFFLPHFSTTTFNLLRIILSCRRQWVSE